MAKKEQKKFQDKLTEPSPKKRTSKKNPNKIGTSNAIKPSLLFEQIFNENDFCFVWLSDNKLLKKINCSENVLKITGFSNKELNNLPGAHHFLIHDKDRRKIQDELSAFFKNEKEKTISLTYRIINKEKKIVWIKEKIFVYCDDKKKSLILKGAAYDISDLKNSEHLFSNKIEKLEDINSSKDIFISKLSHDLRSPYTSILGFLEILMSEPGLSDADKLEYLNYIYASAEKQLRFINCLLDWSRLKTGTIDYKPQRIKVLYTIYNCVAALTHIAVRKNIEVKINVNESLYVYGDENLLNQVITNMLSNAIKFSNEFKTIEIYADMFNYNMVEFVIKDEGIGIIESNKNKVFNIENLYTTEGTKGEKGTGAGLPLVKEIVKKHGGEIWFYSEKDRGTEFHFTIPYLHNTILLIDSDKSNRGKCERIIESNFKEFKLFSVENAYEAIEVISNTPPSIIIIDHNMPLMDGIQFVKFLIKEDKKFNASIILISSQINNEIINSYLNVGVKTFIQKPIDENQLIEKIKLRIK